MKIRTIVITIIIVAISLVPLSYAFEKMGDMPKEDTFFSVDKNEKEIGATLNMYVDLTKIEDKEFNFVLETTSKLLNLSAKTNENKDIVIKENEKGYCIEVNKEELQTEKITLTYIVQNTFKANDKIKLIGHIYDLTETELKKEEVEISIISGKGQEEKKDDKEKQKDNEDMKDMGDFDVEGVIEAMSQTQGNMTQNSNATMGNNNTMQTVTYKGSENNYLSDLSVTGYTLNSAFNKVNTTYFLSVPSDVTSLEINATAEDESNDVSIYGNDNLVTGTNKILVSVTAENESVRTYRIFVTKEK